MCFATTITMHDLVVDLFINRYACGVAVSYGINTFVYWVIVTVRQQSAHSFSSPHSIQSAGKGNLNRNYESTYGLCASSIRGSASSVTCCRTVTVTLYRKEVFSGKSAKMGDVVAHTARPSTAGANHRKQASGPSKRHWYCSWPVRLLFNEAGYARHAPYMVHTDRPCL